MNNFLSLTHNSIVVMHSFAQWRYGREDFYSTLVEYSSWAVLQGYPNAFIYSVSDARILLDKLASADDDGNNIAPLD